MLPDLESLRCFVEAAHTLNFRAASRVVGLTPAALGQRIKQLEQQMEVQLFFRTTRKVELTEAGLALLPAARTALQSASDCVRAARSELGPAPQDVILGTRHELGLSWIVPMLPLLTERHPGVTFNLYFSSGQDLELRLSGREIDIAVSSRRVVDPEIDGVRLHREDYALVAAPALLDAQPLNSMEDAANHVLVDIDRSLPLFRYWRDAPGGSDSLEFRQLRQMGTIAAIRAVVIAGGGVAVLPAYLIEPDLKADRLEVLLSNVEPLHDWFRLLFRRLDARAPLFRSIADTMATQQLR
jgi:LysR family transcriptional regulator, glycine cleavage system transcriptional activator